jgi:hypothetical protein
LNGLYYGDNLAVLRNDIPSESVDLVYLDPPFNSQANYNVLFKSPAGEKSHAQIEAFEDTWHWGDQAEHAFDEVVHGWNTDAAEITRALRAGVNGNCCGFSPATLLHFPLAFSFRRGDCSLLAFALCGRPQILAALLHIEAARRQEGLQPLEPSLSGIS